MSPGLTPKRIEALLDELCRVLGLCLPPDSRARLAHSPPHGVEAFVDGVMEAEGFQPHGGVDLRLRREVQARVVRHFREADEEAS